MDETCIFQRIVWYLHCFHQFQLSLILNLNKISFMSQSNFIVLIFKSVQYHLSLTHKTNLFFTNIT